MAELKNLERDLDRFNTRLLVAALFVLLCFGLLGWRLVVLQVVRHEELALQAEANRIAVLPVVPNRGLIVDRNGVVLATNYSAYTLEITRARVQGDLDAVIDGLSQVLTIEPRDRRRFKRLMEERARALSRCRSAPSSATRSWCSSCCCRSHHSCASAPTGQV